MKKQIGSRFLLILFLLILHGIPAYAADNGHIFGHVLDGSNQHAPLAGQQVTLQMAAGNTTRDLTTATTDAQGAFSFDHLATDKAIRYAVYIRYQGAQYVSDLVTLDTNPAPQLTLTVYQTIHTADNIAIGNVSVLVHEPNVQKGILTISEIFAFINLDTHAYIGSLKASNGPPNALLFSLPQDAHNISLGTGFPGYHVIQVDHGFASDAAVLPGQNTFSFSFDVPYHAAVFDLNYVTMYPTVSLTFLVPPAIHASSPTLTSQGVIATKDQHLYDRLVDNKVPAHQTIQMQLEGLPALPSTNPSTNAGLMWLIVALVGMAAMLLVTWFLLLARRRRVAAKLYQGYERAYHKKSTKGETTHVVTTPVDRKQELLEALLALDQEHEAGTVSKAVYQEQRHKTKAQLRSLMEREKDG